MVVVQWLRLCYAVLAHFDQLVFNVFQVVSGCFKFIKLVQVVCVVECYRWFSFFKVVLVCFSSFHLVSCCSVL